MYRIHKAVEDILDQEGIQHNSIGEAFKLLREDPHYSKVEKDTTANDILERYKEIITEAAEYNLPLPSLHPSTTLTTHSSVDPKIGKLASCLIWCQM